MLNLRDRIDVLVALGHYLQLKDERLQAFMHRTVFNNKWFTKENQSLAIDAITEQWLNRELLESWVVQNDIKDSEQCIKVGIIHQGKTPFDAFHDILATFIMGQKSVVKLSEKDQFMLPFWVKKMNEINPGVADYFEFPDKLPIKEIDAIIATGKGGIIEYYKKYFNEKKALIRNTQHTTAIISGYETKDDFKGLAKDVLSYFGLGYRNVSKIYVPKDYDFNLFLETFHESNAIIQHDAYKNNYDYQISLLILNKVLHWNNGSIILAESDGIHSPISVLHFEAYQDEQHLLQLLERDKGETHHILAQKSRVTTRYIPFGNSHTPGLNDFENQQNIITFLQNSLA